MRTAIQSIDDIGVPAETDLGFPPVPFFAYSVYTACTEEELADMRVKGVQQTKVKPDEPIAAVILIDVDRIDPARNALRSFSYCIRSGRDSGFKHEE